MFHLHTNYINFMADNCYGGDGMSRGTAKLFSFRNAMACTRNIVTNHDPPARRLANARRNDGH